MTKVTINLDDANMKFFKCYRAIDDRILTLGSNLPYGKKTGPFVELLDTLFDCGFTIHPISVAIYRATMQKKVMCFFIGSRVYQEFMRDVTKAYYAIRTT